MVAGGDVFAAKTAAQLETEKVQGWMTILNSIVAWLAGLLALMTYLVTMFLDPAWLNWSLFNMTWVFKEIWILVSNVVYFIFAFILIWIAFMNIIWKWDKWELKQALPKFIIWVLIVPFSWFFIQFILSISAIFTASMITLPADTFQDKYKTLLDQEIIPKECNINFGWSARPVSVKATTWNTNWILSPGINPISWSTNSSNSYLPSYLQPSSTKTNTTIPYKSNYSKWNKNPWIINCEGSGKMTLRKAFTSDNIQWAIFWSIAVYTYWIVNIEKLWEISNKDVVDWIKTIWDFIFKVVFDVLFVLIFSILIITLWLVLIVRWIYIWIYTMISPIFWLMYFFDKKEWGWDFFSKFNLKEFIALSMVPVYVMWALSFGFLFIHIVWQWMYEWSTKWSFNLSNDWKTISIWDIKLNISWSINASSINKSNIIGKGKKVVDNVMWLIWWIIMQLFAIVVLRWAVMAALRSSEITKTITQPIYDFGNKVWWMVAQAPMYAPVFGGQSMTSMQSAASSVSSSIQSQQSQKWAKFATDHFWWLMWDDKSKKLLKLSNDSVWNIGAAKKVLDWTLKEVQSSQEIANSQYARTAIANALETYSRDGKLKDKEESDKLISQLRKSNNASEIRDILSKLDKKWVTWYSILNGNSVVAVWGIDNAISSYNWNENGDNNNWWWNNNKVIIDWTQLKWLWNKYIELKVDSNWLLDLKYEDRDLDNIVKWIKEWSLVSSNIEDFSEPLKEKIKKYFNDKWEYIKSWKQENGRFPWEINNSSNDDEES